MALICAIKVSDHVDILVPARSVGFYDAPVSESAIGFDSCQRFSVIVTEAGLFGVFVVNISHVDVKEITQKASTSLFIDQRLGLYKLCRATDVAHKSTGNMLKHQWKLFVP